MAILFSGGGTDGTVGMKAVKEHGGLLMARMPEDAEHDQMPRSAIATGLVDFVLPADELAEKLVEIRRKGIAPSIPIKPEKLPESDEQILSKILTQIYTRTGHDFSGYKRSTMLRRIARRMRVTSAESLQTYLEFLRGNATEAQALLKDFLISVTNFFRDAEAFDALSEQILPGMMAGREAQEEVRVWVPGCATGEEAYSIAMLLHEESRTLETRPRIQVFATDLDEDALAYGRYGLYPDAVSTDVSEERLKRFFVREGAYYRVGKELRDSVLFASHNLLKDPPFAHLDLVSCRNLLIYLRRDLQEKVYELFHYALRPNGFLFMGSSESVPANSSLFSEVDKAQRLYQRKSAPGRGLHLPDLPLAHARPRQVSRIIRAEPEPSHETSDAELHRRALEMHAPPSALVDYDHRIVHLSETAGRYLRHPGGSATLSIVKVVREELRIELRDALYEALETNEGTIRKPVEMEIEGEPRFVHLYVHPVSQEDGSPRALIIFGETRTSTYDAAAGDTSDAGDERIRRMQEKITTLNVRLQTTIEESETQQEELKSTNEELQSTNEEYKSTLEELETSKEELQSVNEELKTVNEELKDKVEALSRANNDLKNLMEATDVATLFLDRDLRIRRFTQPLTKIFNIMPVDEGRPLSHVTHRLRYDELEKEARNVLDSLVPVQHEVVEAGEGRHYLVRIAPYRTTEDRIGGTVLTFVDVTRLRTAEEELRRTQERYALLIRSVREYAIFLIDTEGRITSWNTGASHLFGYSEQEVMEKPFEIIFVEEDREAGAPAGEMATARQEGQALDERWHKRKNGDRFWGSGIMTAVKDESGALQGFAKVLRDNTHRREAAQALEESRERLERMNEELEQRVEERTSELTEAHDRVRHLASELVKAEQRERHRIAQMLHDDLQQRLYGIQMKTFFIRRDTESGKNDEVLEHVSAVEKWLDETIERTRQLSVDLSPPILMNEGLREAASWLSMQMKDRHGLDVDVQAEESFYMEDEGLRTLLFQVIRELLFNVVKHAGIDHAVVELEREEDEIIIKVHDSGDGFDAETVMMETESTSGFGLFHARERLQFLGGRLEIDSTPGDGTNIVVRVPVSAL